MTVMFISIGRWFNNSQKVEVEFENG